MNVFLLLHERTQINKSTVSHNTTIIFQLGVPEKLVNSNYYDYTVFLLHSGLFNFCEPFHLS